MMKDITIVRLPNATETWLLTRKPFHLTQRQWEARLTALGYTVASTMPIFSNRELNIGATRVAESMQRILDAIPGCDHREAQ